MKLTDKFQTVFTEGHFGGVGVTHYQLRQGTDRVLFRYVHSTGRRLLVGGTQRVTEQYASRLLAHAVTRKGRQLRNTQGW